MFKLHRSKKNKKTQDPFAIKKNKIDKAGNILYGRNLNQTSLIEGLGNENIVDHNFILKFIVCYTSNRWSDIF